MKRTFFTLLLALCFTAGFSQMNNAGGTIVVENNASLVIEGNYTSTALGTIEIDGTVQLKGDFINNSGSVSAGSTGRLKFNGTSAQEITGSQSTTFYCAVEVDNTSGVALTNTSTGADQVLDSALIFTNGKLTLNTRNLTMSNEDATGAGTGKYVVTNSSGALYRSVPADGATNVPFPVGNTAYNPLVLQNAGTGTTDTYGVIAKDGLPGSFAGTTHVVNRHWEVTEGTGTGSALTVTAQWNGTEELASFDRLDCSVGLTTDNGLTVDWKGGGAASGADPWTRAGSTFNNVGKFMVGDYYYEGLDLTADVILGGAYNGTDMSTALLAANKIPLTDPYGNGITVGSIPANVTDWIEVQLRDKTTKAIIKKYSCFVDKNGNVLNPNGNTTAKLTGMVKDQYYIAVDHRNHLGAMTSAAISFATGTASFDFTNLSSTTWGTDAQYNNGSKTMLWPGDTDQSGTVEYVTGTSDMTPIIAEVFLNPLNPSYLDNVPLLNVYSNADADLNANVEYVTGTSDLTPIIFTTFLNPGNTAYLDNVTLTQQLP